MRFISFGAVVLIATAGYAFGPMPSALAAAQPQASATAQPKYSISKTQLSTLLEDPAAKAVLQKHIPALLENPQNMEQAMGMTLKELQDAIKNYAPDVLSDAVLTAIDVDLAVLPSK